MGIAVSVASESVPRYSGTAGGYRVESGLHSSLGNTTSVSSSLSENNKIFITKWCIFLNPLPQTKSLEDGEE